MIARILVVEDNADLAAGIEYNLELEGYDVRVAEDGRSAIEHGERLEAGSRPARSDAARRRRLSGASADSRERQPRARDHPLGDGRRGGQGARLSPRRRSVRHEAVRNSRAARARRRPAAPSARDSAEEHAGTSRSATSSSISARAQSCAHGTPCDAHAESVRAAARARAPRTASWRVARICSRKSGATARSS